MANLDYRQTEMGYRWREWSIVPVDRGVILASDKKMLKQALNSLKDPNPRPLFNEFQESFFADQLIAMQISLEEPAKQKKVRINDSLPTELSVGLSLEEDRWNITARSDFLGRVALDRSLRRLFAAEPVLDQPMHPIAQNMLNIAATILTQKSSFQKYISHQELMDRGWLNDKNGIYSVHPNLNTFEIHYCSLPQNPEKSHYTWLKGTLYINPKPCDVD